jgi:hypothetical protein
METCIVETGLFKKKVCARPAVTHCLNCEGALCAEHALPEVTETGKRSGKFVCQECKLALKEHEKSLASVARKAPEKRSEPAAPKPAAAAPAPTTPPEKKDGGGLDFK